MLPEDDRVIETCRSVLSVFMEILDLLNNIYIYIYMCICWCVNWINYRMHGITIKIDGINLFLRNTKRYNNLSYIPFYMFPFLIYTFVPASTNFLETFLEEIMWKSFISSFAFILMAVASQWTAASLISFEGTAEIRLGPSQEGRGNATMLWLSFARNSLTKPSGVLEHCLDEQTSCLFITFRGNSYWTQPQDDERSSCTEIFVLHQIL